MKSCVFAVVCMLVCIIWSCQQRLEAHRADEQAVYQAERAYIACEHKCGAEFRQCTREGWHASGACSQRYNECMADVRPTQRDK